MTLDPKIRAIGFDMDGTVMNTKVNYEKLGRIFMDEFECQGVPGDIIERHLKTGSRRPLFYVNSLYSRSWRSTLVSRPSGSTWTER